MNTYYALPSQVPQHKLVLSREVVTMQLTMFLPRPTLGEEMAQTGDERIRALADTVSLINQVVDLLRNTLTAHSKHTTLEGNQKVHQPRLERVTVIMDLSK